MNKKRIMLQLVLAIAIMLSSGACMDAMDLARLLTVRIDGEGVLTLARTDTEVRDDYLEAIMETHSDIDATNLPQSTNEIYVSSINRDGEEQYLATMCRLASNATSKYTLVGALSGEMCLVKDDIWLLPNGYLFDLDVHGVTRQSMRANEITGEVLTIFWPCQGPKIAFYQKPLLNVSARIKLWFQARQFELPSRDTIFYAWAAVNYVAAVLFVLVIIDVFEASSHRKVRKSCK